MHTTAAIQRGVVARAPTQPRTARRVVCASNVHKTLSHAVTTNPAAILATTLLSAAPAMADDLPIDASAALDAASSLAVSADPVLIAGAGAIVILGGGTFALTRSLSASKVRGTTPEKALDALSQEARVVLVDIRSKQAIKEDGSPDLKIVKRKPVAVPYTEVVGEEIQPVEGFVEKLLANPSIKEDSILILIDSYVGLCVCCGVCGVWVCTLGVGDTSSHACICIHSIIRVCHSIICTRMFSCTTYNMTPNTPSCSLTLPHALPTHPHALPTHPHALPTTPTTPPTTPTTSSQVWSGCTQGSKANPHQCEHRHCVLHHWWCRGTWWMAGMFIHACGGVYMRVVVYA